MAMKQSCPPDLKSMYYMHQLEKNPFQNCIMNVSYFSLINYSYHWTWSNNPATQIIMSKSMPACRQCKWAACKIGRGNIGIGCVGQAFQGSQKSTDKSASSNISCQLNQADTRSKRDSCTNRKWKSNPCRSAKGGDMINWRTCLSIFFHGPANHPHCES